MRKLSLLIFAIAFSSSVYAQVIGKMFPDMEAETVEDKIVKLPTATAGKYTLLGLAYSKKSETELKSTGLMSGFGYDVNVYFVPMFTGINAAATGTAKRKALKDIDAQLLPYVLFYKGELKPYKDTLDFEKKDIPYFFVLDPAGKIIYATSGKYTEDKMDTIEGVIE